MSIEEARGENSRTMDDKQALIESQLELETGNSNYQPHALEDSDNYLMDITDSLIIAQQIAPLKEPGGHGNTLGTIQSGENKS